MYKIVNGYPCTSGCDVDLARRNVDPRNPHNDPIKEAELQAKDPAKALARELRETVAAGSGPQERRGSAYGPAVLYGGSLSGPPLAASATVTPGSTVDRLV